MKGRLIENERKRGGFSRRSSSSRREGRKGGSKEMQSDTWGGLFVSDPHTNGGSAFKPRISCHASLKMPMHMHMYMHIYKNLC